ncbi:receptor-like protein EIX1 [Ziziphus jujuba]|uniref:Receptor-like protein EIX1 n=1 Tax=Ziziphus jujuba TaxID=326968 RepID=A0ABM3ZS00_ZIZJJ|nr:receptor-like protein EIX1 [Ziziphus jujuba]
MTSIITLDLSENELQGDLPSMAQLCKLKEIDLSGNTWNRSISQILDSFSGCLSDRLKVLKIQDGQIYGHLTNKIGQFKSLTDLDLSSNSISGLIPESLWQLVNLEWLNIGNNHMEGTLSEAHFANTTSLRSFYASNNPLILKVDQDWVPPFQLESLDMGSWHLGPRFPLWVRSQKKLSYLGLYNTSLADVLPLWVFNFSSELEYLDLSQNQMHGRIPNLTNMGTQKYLEIDLSQNHFEGPLPLVSSKVVRLDLSDNLLSGSISQFLCSSPIEPMKMASLYLAKNQLSGNLPNCWSKWNNIKVLNLNNNSFGGAIPSSFGSLIFLQSLHLRNNNLFGILSLSSLQNCINLVILDLSWNKFGGNVPTWLGTGPSMLRFLFAGFNEFHGHIPRNYVLSIPFKSWIFQTTNCSAQYQNVLTISLIWQ